MDPKLPSKNSGSSGDRIRTCDLEVMGLVSCLTALPRDSAGFLRLFFVCLCLSLPFPAADRRQGVFRRFHQ